LAVAAVSILHTMVCIIKVWAWKRGTAHKIVIILDGVSEKERKFSKHNSKLLKFPSIDERRKLKASVFKL
jgi:hypothetical protein